MSPAALSPSRVTWKVLSVSLADVVGLSCTENCVQLVAVAAWALIELEANTAPLLDTSEAVRLPLNVEVGENLKKKEASYVHDALTFIPVEKQQHKTISVVDKGAVTGANKPK